MATGKGLIRHIGGMNNVPQRRTVMIMENEGVFYLSTGELSKISLSSTRLVQAWVELHRHELMENYDLLQQEVGSFKKIKPLM
jgi:arginine decarboxylase-like protein